MGALAEMGWDGFHRAMWLQARRERVPLTGTLELTPLCNFRCRMCYVRLDASDAAARGGIHAADEWLALAREAMTLGTYRVTLTGGEVLTRPDFEEIYRGLVEMGLVVHILTNGSLVDGRTLALFRELPPAMLRVTLYGASNATYERLCGAPDGFDRTMGSIRALRDAGVPVSLAFTQTRENVGDLREVLDIAEGLRVSIGVSTHLFPAVRGATSEARALRVPAAEQPRPDRPYDNLRQDPTVRRPGEQELADDPAGALFARCKSFRSSFVVEWNGQMETCSFMSSCGANAFEEGFSAAWSSLQEGLDRLSLPKECRACELASRCPICPGLREAETGRPDGVPRDLCAELRAGTLSRQLATAAKGGD